MGKIPGNRQISGKYGMLYWDGEPIYEVEAFEAKLTINREDVQQVGEGANDSKITGYKGEGMFRVKKVFSRGQKKIAQAIKEGRDPRSQLVGKLADPDSYGTERVVLNNVWFNEVILMQFEVGQVLNREFPFGFTDWDFPDLIEVQ
ncbi:terminase [Crassaminicella thermophila]|uniref:Terminase n=1 Tax=Crassaminicella thermophila TaxID=2599308 RepID=A0A5C0SAU6_CRATE|nr:phage tail tube protein [Crassaminicella thermophila]QEK11695.1 terminase [Crassaminicella thermophila]